MSSLLAADVALRPVDAVTDRELLVRVYRSTREEELSAVPWSAEELDAFIRMQFAAQDRYWSAQRPAAERSVVVVDGADAGRLYVDRTPQEIRIVDIALLPEQRGRGAGGALLRSILDESDRTGVPVTIHVEKGNRARSLYARLGFRPVADAGAYDLHERRPDGAAPTPTRESPT